MRKLIYIVGFLVSQVGVSQSSVLSSGSWAKVGVTEKGIYKLDQSSLISLGFDVNSVDPSTLKVYGNGIQGMLPQPNSEERPEDLIENAVFLSGDQDGSFDAADYLLFFASGPDKELWTEEGLIYQQNVYSDTSYYFITVGGSAGKRISAKSSMEGSATTVLSTFDDHLIFEEDKRNIIGSGREWYGEPLNDGESSSESIRIEGLSSDITLTFTGASQSPQPNFFTISSNGTAVGDLQLSSIDIGEGSTYRIKAREATETFMIDQAEDVTLRFLYEGNTVNSRGYLDRYYLEFERNLQLYSAQTIFRSASNVGELIEYQVANAAEAKIWDVTSPTDARNQEFVQMEGMASFISQSNTVEEYVVFSGSDFPTPVLFGKVENQDLRGDTNYEGLIVAHESFLNEAKELAQFHEAQDGITVKIVTPTQIYNEFSSGRQDVSAIRDYAKHLYEGGAKLKYLLLFGDCSYDYKYREENNTNFVPTYESLNSFHPIFSHSSDDYFGFFEEDEGEWIESRSGDHTMEIGIGRLPAKSKAEAQTMVDKIIYYSTSPNTLGKWRNQIAYLGDDGDGNIHARHIEDLSELIDTTYAQYQIDKLLLDAFNQEVGATQESSPETTRALKTRIKEGTFTINFIGHGNERLWMEEEILTNEIIRDLTNLNKMPIFITATCEFGRYDDPRQESGAEKLLLNENGGAIALLTTSRPVFASTNFELNEAFHRNVFQRVDGRYQRLGDIIRVTKNEGLAGSVNRNFTLLGDPMMMPAFPQLDIEINELSAQMDTLSALEQVTFTGAIMNDGAKDDTFNGTLDVVIFDEKQEFKTKGQQSSPYSYTLRSNALFRGKASVRNGEFSFAFAVPKTISYQFKRGKMSLYAADIDQNKDASGSSKEFVIGGTNSEVESDNQAPSVTMYLNDESFRNGASVSTSSVLLAKIADQNGITTTGNGLVQGISLQLNEEVINLNEFYTADIDTYQRGTVVYPLQNLVPGDYVATLKVYDTHNNLATQQLSFTVVEGAFISLFNTVTYPNPATSYTIFSFEHDREEEDLDISLIVYNAHGEVVSKKGYEFQNSQRLIEVQWETRTNSGQPLNRGIYFYRVIIRSRFDGAVKEIANKLVIVN